MKKLVRILSLSHFRTSGLATALAFILSLAIVAWGYRLYTTYSIVSLSGLPMPGLRFLWRGMISDSGVAIVWALVSVYLLRLAVLKYISVWLWCLLLTGNMTNIVVNNANLSAYSFDDGLQKDFILGTVLTAAILVPAVIGFAGFAVLHLLFRQWLLRFSRRTLAEILALCCFATAFFMNVKIPVHKAWASFNVVEDNIRNIYLLPQPRLMPINNHVLGKFIHRDLSGKKIVPDVTSPPNILLVTIESLSAAMTDAGWTPNLARRSHEGLYYPNFVNPSRRTVNGMYSLLCGDFPLLLYKGGSYRTFWTTSKGSSVYDQRKQRYCLPRMLSDHQYKTVYMQATDVRFEHQGDLNNLLGFHEQKSAPNFVFENYVGNAGWGPNDPSFFKIAEKKIDFLQQEGRPWFLTLLTIGTHHPWQVPPPYNFARMPAMKRSFMYMDMALDEFLNNLEASGVMKNTLVIITSDESSAPTNPNYASPRSVLPENRGFMLIYTPEKHKEVMPEVFAQPDLFLSIADYIGADTSNIPYGRSLFRHYDAFRPMFMGSVFSHHLMGMIEPRKMILCYALILGSCRQFAMASDDLFNTPFRQTELSKGTALFFQSMAVRIQNTVFPKVYPLPEKTH